MRSDIASASSWSWVTYRNVIPTSRWMPLSSTCICLRSFRSSAPSGSSSSSTAGRFTSARASATRCFCPPESSRGFESLAAAQLRRARAPPPRASRISSVGDLAPLQPERHVVVHVEVLEERVALEDGVDVAPVRRHRLDRLALEEDAALARLLEPGDHPQRRGLAAARRAEQREELALPNRDVEPLDRDVAAEALGHALEADRLRRLRHAVSLPTSTPEPALAPAEQARQRDREADQHRRDGEHEGADRVDGRRDPEPDRRVDPHRQRLRRLAGREERDHEVVEAEREHEQRGGEDRPATARAA